MTTQDRMHQKLSWLSVDHVASRLHVSPDHVRSLIHQGKLDAVDVSAGRRPTYRISPESLQAFLTACEVR